MKESFKKIKIKKIVRKEKRNLIRKHDLRKLLLSSLKKKDKEEIISQYNQP